MIGIPQQIVSFLSSFKAFFFFTIAFIVFGSAFLFLSQPLCEKGWLCNNYLQPILGSNIFNFADSVGIIKFLIFAYIVGLLIYEFSRLIFKIVRYIPDRKQKEEKKRERPNDIDIYTFLGGRDLARDIYMLQVFYSSVARLLLGTVGLAVILFSPQSWILFLLSIIVSFVFLIWINVSADGTVHALGEQIKDIMKNGEYQKKKEGDK